MKSIRTSLPGVVVLEMARKDGSRKRLLPHDEQQAAGVVPAHFAQSRCCQYDKYRLAGLYYQKTRHQGQEHLLQVSSGEAYAVAVDIRRDSPHDKHWTAVMLTAANGRALWVPEGFAYGLCTLSGSTTVVTQSTQVDVPSLQRRLRWNDACLAINWPVKSPVLSDEDAKAPFLEEMRRSLA